MESTTIEKMDRNSAIGLTLIAALLLAYFYWFSPKPQPQSSQPAVTETPPEREPPETKEAAQTPPDDDIPGETGANVQFSRDGQPIVSEDVPEARRVGHADLLAPHALGHRVVAEHDHPISGRHAAVGSGAVIRAWAPGRTASA